MATPLSILLEAEDKASQAYVKAGATITDAIKSVMETTGKFEVVSKELDVALKVRAGIHEEVAESLKRMGMASPATAEEFENLAILASEGSITTNKYRDAYDALYLKVKANEKQFGITGKEVDKFHGILREFDKSTQHVNRYSRAQASLTIDMQRWGEAFPMLRKAMHRHTGLLMKTGRGLSAAAIKTQAMTDALGGMLGVTITAAAILGSLVKAARDFDAVLVDIRRQIRLTRAETEMWQESIFTMSTELRASALDIGKVYQIAARAQIRAREDVERFTRSVFMMSQVTGASEQSIADLQVMMYRTFNLGMRDIEGINSSILTVVQSSSLLTEEMQGVFEATKDYVLLLSRDTRRVALPAIAAMAGALKDMGLQPEGIMRSLGKMMNEFSVEGQRTAAIMSGFLGVSVSEIRKDLEAGRPDEIIAKIGLRAQQSGRDLKTTAKLLSSMGETDLANLLLQSEEYNNNLAGLSLSARLAMKENRALSEAYNDMQNSFSRVTKVLKNQLVNIWMRIAVPTGKVLGVVFKALSVVLQGLTFTFGLLPGPIKTVMGAVVGLTLAVGAINMVWASWLGKIIATTIATKAAVVAQWALNAAMYANPIGLIIIGVVALGVALWTILERWQQINDVVDYAFIWWKNLFMGAWGWVSGLVDRFWFLMVPLGAIIKAMKVIGKIWSWFSGDSKVELTAPVPVEATPMQHGGIVTSPTRALIGEAGPEAVIPLAAGAGPGGGIQVDNKEVVAAIKDLKAFFQSTMLNRQRALPEDFIHDDLTSLLHNWGI